jgi:PHD/YefM family antitoxin component YafN of YafNO toxin-antitoxin module
MSAGAAAASGGAGFTPEPLQGVMHKERSKIWENVRRVNFSLAGTPELALDAGSTTKLSKLASKKLGEFVPVAVIDQGKNKVVYISKQELSKLQITPEEASSIVEQGGEHAEIASQITDKIGEKILRGNREMAQQLTDTNIFEVSGITGEEMSSIGQFVGNYMTFSRGSDEERTRLLPKETGLPYPIVIGANYLSIEAPRVPLHPGGGSPLRKSVEITFDAATGDISSMSNTDREREDVLNLLNEDLDLVRIEASEMSGARFAAGADYEHEAKFQKLTQKKNNLQVLQLQISRGEFDGDLLPAMGKLTDIQSGIMRTYGNHFGPVFEQMEKPFTMVKLIRKGLAEVKKDDLPPEFAPIIAMFEQLEEHWSKLSNLIYDEHQLFFDRSEDLTNEGLKAEVEKFYQEVLKDLTLRRIFDLTTTLTEKQIEFLPQIAKLPAEESQHISDLFLNSVVNALMKLLQPALELQGKVGHSPGLESFLDGVKGMGHRMDAGRRQISSSLAGELEAQSTRAGGLSKAELASQQPKAELRESVSQLPRALQRGLGVPVADEPAASKGAGGPSRATGRLQIPEAFRKDDRAGGGK